MSKSALEWEQWPAPSPRVRGERRLQCAGVDDAAHSHGAPCKCLMTVETQFVSEPSQAEASI